MGVREEIISKLDEIANFSRDNNEDNIAAILYATLASITVKDDFRLAAHVMIYNEELNRVLDTPKQTLQSFIN